MKFFELLAEGTPVDEAARSAGLSILDLAHLIRHDKDFQALWDAWEHGMSLVMEGKLTEQGMRGRTVAILNFLRAVDPSRWSEKLQVEQLSKQETTVRVVFGWTPPDIPSLPDAQVNKLKGGAIEIEALPPKESE